MNDMKETKSFTDIEEKKIQAIRQVGDALTKCGYNVTITRDWKLKVVDPSIQNAIEIFLDVHQNFVCFKYDFHLIFDKRGLTIYRAISDMNITLSENTSPGTWTIDKSGKVSLSHVLLDAGGLNDKRSIQYIVCEFFNEAKRGINEFNALLNNEYTFLTASPDYSQYR